VIFSVKVHKPDFFLEISRYADCEVCSRSPPKLTDTELAASCRLTHQAGWAFMSEMVPPFFFLS